MRKFVLGLIGLYQKLISPAIKIIWPFKACRFKPTCSEYAAAAISKYGVAKGGWLGLKRLICCHPFAKGGFWPLP